MTYLLLLMGAPGGSGFAQILPMLLIIVVFYFFMIRPQIKKAKEPKKMRESQKKETKSLQ